MKEFVRISNEQYLDRSAKFPGDSESAFSESADFAIKTPGPLGKNEQAAARCQIAFKASNAFHHRFGIDSGFGRKDVSGDFQHPSENGNLQESVFYDCFLPFKYGNEDDWIKVREMIAYNDTRANGTYIIINPNFQLRDN